MCSKVQLLPSFPSLPAPDELLPDFCECWNIFPPCSLCSQTAYRYTAQAAAAFIHTLQCSPCTHHLYMHNLVSTHIHHTCIATVDVAHPFYVCIFCTHAISAHQLDLCMFTVHSLPIMYTHFLYVYTYSRHMLRLFMWVPTLNVHVHCT